MQLKKVRMKPCILMKPCMVLFMVGQWRHTHATHRGDPLELHTNTWDDDTHTVSCINIPCIVSCIHTWACGGRVATNGAIHSMFIVPQVELSWRMLMQYERRWKVTFDWVSHVPT